MWENIIVESVITITKAVGYDNTHYCEWCHEYSTSDTSAPCHCGYNSWEEWTDEDDNAPTRYHVGRVIKQR